MDRNPDDRPAYSQRLDHHDLIHPETRRISVFRNDHFEPYEPQAAALPRAATSVDWYRGWRDHLEFAEIGQ